MKQDQRHKLDKNLLPTTGLGYKIYLANFLDVDFLKMINQFFRMRHEFPNEINIISVLSNTYLFFVFRLMISDLLITNCFYIPKDNLQVVDELGVL